MTFHPVAPSGQTSVYFAPTGLTGATAASRYVGGTASGPPASGTFAIGDFVIDQTGVIWICTTAGSPGTWTRVGGPFLCAPSVYAPVSQTAKSASTTTMAAFFSTSINTGSFVAPASGNVIVRAAFMGGSAVGTFVAVGLAAHGTVTPIVANENVFQCWTSDTVAWNFAFYVTGLTPGTSYNFDLLGAASTGSFQITAFAVTSTTPTLSGAGVGGPVIMTVEAV